MVLPPDTFSLLQRAPLFRRMNDEDLTAVVEMLKPQSVPAGTVLFKEGELRSVCYIVASGRVELYTVDFGGEEVRLQVSECGGVFGEMSLFDNAPRSASARTLEDCHLLTLDHDALHALIMEHPHVAFGMLADLTSRLRSTTALVQERVVLNVNEAVAAKSSLVDRLSDVITHIFGNIYFVILSLVWFVVWIVWNLEIIPGTQAFDRYPFGLLTTIVSLEMVLLSLFILIKQERQAANDKVRNDIEYEINVRAELGVRALGRQMARMEERMLKRLEALEGKGK